MSEHKGNILHEALGSDDDQMDDSIRVNRKYASKFIEKKKKEEYNKGKYMFDLIFDHKI